MDIAKSEQAVTGINIDIVYFKDIWRTQQQHNDNDNNNNNNNNNKSATNTHRGSTCVDVGASEPLGQCCSKPCQHASRTHTTVLRDPSPIPNRRHPVQSSQTEVRGRRVEWRWGWTVRAEETSVWSLVSNLNIFQNNLNVAKYAID